MFDQFDAMPKAKNADKSRYAFSSVKMRRMEVEPCPEIDFSYDQDILPEFIAPVSLRKRTRADQLKVEGILLLFNFLERKFSKKNDLAIRLRNPEFSLNTQNPASHNLAIPQNENPVPQRKSRSNQENLNKSNR